MIDRIEAHFSEHDFGLWAIEISGVAAEGSVLDFLIRTFFLPLYPNAKIGQPFELGFNMERLQIHPSGVVVRIGSRRTDETKRLAPPSYGRR